MHEQLPKKPSKHERPFSLSDVGSTHPAQPPRGFPAPPTSSKPLIQRRTQPGGLGGGTNSKKRLLQAHEQVKAKQYNQAAQTLRPLLRKKKPDPGALHLMAVIYEQLRQTPKALEYALQAHRATPNDMSKMIIARSYRVLGKTDECVQWVEKILSGKSHANDLLPLALKAGALEEAGRVEEAESVLVPVIEHAHKKSTTLPAPVWDVWARVLVQQKQYSQAIEIIDDVLDKISAEQGKVGLLHLKAKACDRSGQYDLAWEAASQANAIGCLDYDPELHTEQVETLIKIWSRECMREFPMTKCDSLVPVFVAGMPRSGTSLIDQIIDAHPKASGIGELSSIEQFALALSKNYDPHNEPDMQFGSMGSKQWQRTADAYVKHILSVSPKGTERVVNKALGNNKLVGLIARLFPKTRIIHAIRDPRDVAISCFMGGFNNQMHPWTARADWTAHTWALSARMMDHWKATLDVPILDVHYEQLVAHPEKEFPRLIEFLGLDFDPSCYDFYRSRRTVRTLSYDQVNRPLYTTSSGRYRNYQRHIEGIDFPSYHPQNSAGECSD